MRFIKGDVVALLEDSTIVYSPKVKDAYSDITGFLPCITVEELDNREAVNSTVHGEALSDIALQVEVYGATVVDGAGDVVPPSLVTERIAAEVATILDQFGLTRVYGRMLPYDQQDTTRRYILRYECVVDFDGNITKTR